jgi:hypothetical protein
VGGLIFGFSPYMLAHSLDHPNLVICVTPPLALLIVAELFVLRAGARRRCGEGAGHLRDGPAQLRCSHARHAAGPGALAGLSRAWTGDDAEWNAYIGVPLIALLAFIAVRWRSIPLVLWSAILGAVIALLSLGPHLHLGGVIHFHVPLPWLWLQHLPVFDNVLPARLMLFFYLVAGLAVAFFVRELRQHATGWKAPAGWAWIGVSLLFLLPAVSWPATPNPVPEFFSGGGVTQIPAGSVALVAPFSTAPGF